MTVLPRGGRNRRSGRRPGWLLLTALLVLAILASATLVFTTRVELLRLAVILSLWAAVLAAFVSVIYRRQSEADQARARDMKYVYDLQLDREISARREYELNVEAQLRRQLSKEIRSQAADEMVALRAELMALRSQLEVMLGTDLGVRPALEAEPMAMPMPGRVESSRVTTAVITEVDTTAVLESPIIDVPEEPLVVPPPPPPAPRVQPAREAAAPDYRGSHRRTERDNDGPPPWQGSRPARPAAPPAPRHTPPQTSAAPWRPPETKQGRHRNSEAAAAEAEPFRGRHRVDEPDTGAPAGRHRTPEEQRAADAAAAEAAESQGQHSGGQSLADLLAKLQVKGQVAGGGRRRRED